MTPIVSHIATMTENGNETDFVDFTWNRRQDLAGCSLRVAFLHDPPFVFEIKKNEAIPKLSSNCLDANEKMICGSYIQLFRVLVKAINFTIEWVKVDDNKYGSFDVAKQEWNGVTGALHHGKADVSLVQLSVTPSRSKVIKYSVQITKTEARMYVKRQEYEGSWYTYIEVFDSVVWFSLLLMCLLASCTGCIIFISTENKSCTTKYISSFGSAFSFFWGAFNVSQGNDLTEKTTRVPIKSLRIFTFFIYVFGVTMYCHYEGKLISHVISRDTPLPIYALQDILDNPEYQLMVQSGSAEENYFKLATEWPENKIWAKTMMGNEKAFVSSATMDTTLMEDRKKILFSISYYSEMYMPNYPCNIRRLGETYLQGSSNALAFPIKSPYHEMFSHMLTKLKNFGTWDLILKRMNEDRYSVPCAREETTLVGVDYKTTFSLFAILAVGILISIGYSMFEVAHHKVKT